MDLRIRPGSGFLRRVIERMLPAPLVLLCMAVAVGFGYWGLGPATLPHASAVSVAAPTVASSFSVSAAHPSVVVIDAGHQAHGNKALEPIGPGSGKKKPAVASGTSGVATHVHESVINLKVALRLRSVLRAAGVTVVMVRTSEHVNITNSKRAMIANAAHADLFVRIHCDGSKSRSTRGFLTLVPARNRWTGPIVSASARAGRDIQKASVAITGARDRGITPRSDMSGFNWSRVPSVIVEMGLMTNPAEDRLLSSAAYQQKLASGMASGILSFLHGK